MQSKGYKWNRNFCFSLTTDSFSKCSLKILPLWTFHLVYILLIPSKGNTTENNLYQFVFFLL